MVNAPAGANAPAAFPVVDPHSRLTMTLAARTVLVTLSAGLTVAALWAASRIRPVADVEMKPDPAPVQAHPGGIKGLPVGAAGCLGAACHGAPACNTLEGKFDDGTWQTSGSCWVAADPHTAAYSLLTPNPYRPVKVTAGQIMARYAGGKPATEDARCLACHTNPTLAEPGHTGDARIIGLRAEGVGCEACHGNAGGWLRQHTTWHGKRDAVYHETGMVRLYDVGERAAACVGCHVGAPEAVVGKGPDGRDIKLAVRDMNHDMIAAGHPRLNFDFADYMRRLPVHWQEKDRTEKGNVPRGPDFLVKAWLVGRVAHAEAACKLLASRAERSGGDRRTPWPEFAEFNCAACHHGLLPDGRKGKGAEPPADGEPWSSAWRNEVLGDRPIGTPPWQTVWPVTPALGLKPHQPKELFAKAAARHEPPVQALLKAIHQPRPALAADVQPGARATAEVLGRLRAELSAWPDAEFPGLARKAFDDLDPFAPDWDSAVQMLFGLGALERRRIAGEPGTTPAPVYQSAFDAYRDTKSPEAERWKKIRPPLDLMFPRK